MIADTARKITCSHFIQAWTSPVWENLMTAKDKEKL